MNIGTFHGIIGSIGDIANVTDSATVYTRFENIISLTLGVLTVSAGLWFVFQIFGGALGWLASGGEKQALQNAQKRIVNAVVGLLVIVLSYTFIAIISAIFGLYILSPFAALGGVTPPQVGNGQPCVPTHGITPC